MSIAKLSLTSRQLTDLIITSRFEYWAETDGKGLVFGVKNVAAPAVYRQAMIEAVKNLQFLGFWHIIEFISTNSYPRRRTPMFTRFVYRVAFGVFSIFAVFSLFAVLPVFADSTDGLSTGKVTLVFDHTLPNVSGKSMKGVLVEYQPGGSSPAHSHPGSAFIYATVLEGAIRSKINDEPEKVYHAGESFAEVPGDHHVVSANDSDTQSASLLAVFVVNTDEKNLVTPDMQG